MKLTKTQVQKSIHQQSINGETIYYSYAEKCQATLSILKNQRLLIFNFNNGMLYYINEPKQLPFKTEIPKPKNECANINVSLVKNPPDTNQLSIEFAMKNQKNQQVSVSWVFVLQNKALAKDWLKTIQQFKYKKIMEITQAQQTKQPNQQEKQNNAFIHDTLGFGLLRGSKKQQPLIQGSNKPPSQSLKNSQIKPQPSIINSQSSQDPRLKPSQSNVGIRQSQQGGSQSNLIGSQDPKLKPSQSNLNLRQSEQGSPSKYQSPQRQPQNIRQSNVNIRSSGLGVDKPGVQQSNIRRSNISNKNQINSPELKGSIHQLSPGLNQSKLTLRDQLESIVQRSHLRQSKFENVSLGQSQISDKNYRPQDDWNLKFLKNQSEDTIYQFQQFAVKSFFKILEEDRKATESLRVYLKQPQIVIIVTDARTPEAKKIKSEFRNYHFIMDSCKEQFIVGVPLATLIQHQGLVAMVKSTVPFDAPKLQLTQQIMLDLKDLERYTRIKNSILKKAVLYDLTDIYQTKIGRRLIYINQLIQYLPIHIEQNFRGGSLRPEHLLDNVNQFMQGGMAHEANRQDMKILHQALDHIRTSVRELAKQLSTQDLMFANCEQLKQIMHSRGINLKYLPHLYSEVSNKNVKKYINTIMVSKVIKDDILQNLSSLSLDSKGKIVAEQTLQNSLRLLIEGGTNISSEFWKQIAINFRKEYSTPMNNHDILGPFLLSCLMKLIPAKYDLTKLNVDKKTFFKDEGIIGNGFVVQILPKVKSYYRYTTQLTDKIMATCRGEKMKENFEIIVEELELSNKQIPKSFQLSKTNLYLKQYLSYYAPPSQFESKSFSHLNTFQCVNIEPPTSLSLQTTKNYLDWCLDKQKLEPFKKVLEQTLAIIDFWFDPQHLYHCQFYECLSNYYQLTGSIEESINFMKESLAICIRNGGVTAKKTGHKYFNLGEKELRSGRKNDSMDNFIKAKNNMENYNDQTLNYPITLMKLSSLYLNSSDFQNCVIYSKQAVEKFEQLQTKNKNGVIPKGYYDQYCIKAIEIMTRAFEIQGKKNQFYRIAQLSSIKYNKTKNPQVFEQLVKICITAVIFKQSIQKCQLFQTLIEKISLSNKQSTSENISPQRCLDELMILAESFNVMERFMFKFQSLQRIATDMNSRRALSTDGKQFITITKNVIGAIGEDYLYGLIQQKQFQ